MESIFLDSTRNTRLPCRKDAGFKELTNKLIIKFKAVDPDPHPFSLLDPDPGRNKLKITEKCKESCTGTEAIMIVISLKC